MKVSKHIKELIKEISEKESELMVLWREFYKWCDKHKIDTDRDEIADLYQGSGTDYLIKWLEEL